MEWNAPSARAISLPQLRPKRDIFGEALPCFTGTNSWPCLPPAWTPTLSELIYTLSVSTPNGHSQREGFIFFI